ncbi:MAG: hypothetical protein CW691_08470 [Candidatus Bathyarchaeum sp.]|nr:MAG: hypothetical protein CW691_08470 [Candidatus Bathyarchaeum sp.]
MPETQELPLNGLKEWLNKNTTSLVEPLREEAKKNLDDVKSKLVELMDGCDKLLDDAEKEMARGSRKTYRRAKALFKLAGTFQSSIEEINIPEEINGQTLKETLDQLTKTMNMIDQEKTKWFRAISPYFILSRRRFDASFKRAEYSFQTYRTFVAEDYSKAEKAENVFSKIDELRQSSDEYNNYETSRETRNKKKDHVESKIAETEKQLESLQSKGEVVELAQLNSRIEELTEAINHELRHLKKPLLKFESLINSPGYNLFPDAASKLEEYMSNPFNALATEKEGYPLLKTILQKIDSALDNKKMKLKPSRLRKAKDQIKRITEKEALISLQNSTKESFSKRKELSTSGIITETRDEKTELQEQLKELQRQKGILKTRDALLEKDHKEAKKRVEEQKRSLEKIITELSDIDVKIMLD